MKLKTISISLGALVLAACSNPQDPSEYNFKAAIQDYYAKKQACFNIRADFPYQLAKSAYSYQRESEVFSELVSIGFLEETETEKEVKFYFGSQPPKKEPATTYSMTAAGKAASKSPEKSFLSMGGTNFCYGEYKVSEITNFTEPADFMGQKVSEVHFKYKAENISDWAKNSPLLQAKFKEIARDIASSSTPIDGEAALILTNNGWVHEKLFRN